MHTNMDPDLGAFIRGVAAAFLLVPENISAVS
jgi:hypothetical protein